MTLTPAVSRDLAFTIQHALGYGLDGKHLGKRPMEPAAMAAHILARSGYVVMQKPPARAHSSTNFDLRSVP